MTPRPDPIRRILEIAKSLTISSLCDDYLFDLPPSCTQKEAQEKLKLHGFDRAPVREEPYRRYIAFDDLTTSELTVDEAARVIDAPHVVADTLPLADAIELLEKREWLFVLKGPNVGELITRADLQLPAVGMLTFAFILAAEAGLDVLIEERREDWLGLLSPAAPRAWGADLPVTSVPQHRYHGAWQGLNRRIASPWSRRSTRSYGNWTSPPRSNTRRGQNNWERPGTRWRTAAASSIIFPTLAMP